jgi:RNA-directed DNA polymerase
LTSTIKPSTARFQALKAKARTLCQQAAGAPPDALVDRLNPLLRGGANSHRHTLGGRTFFRLDSFGGRRLFRRAKRRHPDKTGRWIADRSFPPQPRERWRFPAPATSKQVLRVCERLKPARSLKVKSAATPFDPDGEAYFRTRDQRAALRAALPFRAKLLRQQHGLCPGCRQMIPSEEEGELPQRDGNPQNNHLANLVWLHPTYHHQVHYASGSPTAPSRPSRGVGHA